MYLEKQRFDMEVNALVYMIWSHEANQRLN